MTSVAKNLAFLQLLSSTGPQQVDAMLKTGNAQQLEILRQITRNILESRLVLDKKSVNQLRRYEKRLIHFADSKKFKVKKKLCLGLKSVWPRLLKAVLPQLELLSG
jgi:hypothetical protein